MRRTFRTLHGALDTFHRSRVERCVHEHSPLAGPQFRGDFNLAGHYPAVHALADSPGSFWGIDRCLRIRESVDPCHSRLFHMGVCARAVRGKWSRQPWADPAFQQLQRAMLEQFLAMVDGLGIDPRRLQVSCFGGAMLGGHPDGRDRRLRRPRRFPADRVSRHALRRRGITVIDVPAIASFFIQPEEGSLVGPRLEVFYDDLEFATIVFAYARITGGVLAPINHVAAYGVGVERLLAILNNTDFLHGVPRYVRARRLIERRIAAAGSPALRRDVTHVLFGIEALAALPPRLSPPHRALVIEMKRELKAFVLNLGLSNRDVIDLFDHFQRGEH